MNYVAAEESRQRVASFSMWKVNRKQNSMKENEMERDGYRTLT
jgi:hypothetical protein